MINRKEEFISICFYIDIQRYEYNLGIFSESTNFAIQLSDQDKLKPYPGGFLTLDGTKELISFLQDTVKEFEDKEKECG